MNSWNLFSTYLEDTFRKDGLSGDKAKIKAKHYNFWDSFGYSYEVLNLQFRENVLMKQSEPLEDNIFLNELWEFLNKRRNSLFKHLSITTAIILGIFWCYVSVYSFNYQRAEPVSTINNLFPLFFLLRLLFSLKGLPYVSEFLDWVLSQKRASLCLARILSYALCSMHCILCMVFYALCHMHCILCIQFHAL